MIKKACCLLALFMLTASVSVSRGASPEIEDEPIPAVSVRIGYGLTDARFEQSASDSISVFEGWGRELSLRGTFHFEEYPISLVGEYSTFSGSRGTEEVESHDGLLLSELEPDIRRIRLAVGYRLGEPGRPGVQADLGYRWLKIDFLRRDFRGTGPVLVPPFDFVTQDFRMGGPSITLESPLPPRYWLGRNRLAILMHIDGEVSIPLQVEVKDSRGADFDSEGYFWRGRGEIGLGAESWSVSLGLEYTRFHADGAGPATTPAGLVTLGDSDYRVVHYSLAFRARI